VVESLEDRALARCYSKISQNFTFFFEIFDVLCTGPETPPKRSKPTKWDRFDSVLQEHDFLLAHWDAAPAPGREEHMGPPPSTPVRRNAGADFNIFQPRTCEVFINFPLISFC